MKDSRNCIMYLLPWLGMHAALNRHDHHLQICSHTHLLAAPSGADLNRRISCNHCVTAGLLKEVYCSPFVAFYGTAVTQNRAIDKYFLKCTCLLCITCDILDVAKNIPSLEALKWSHRHIHLAIVSPHTVWWNGDHLSNAWIPRESKTSIKYQMQEMEDPRPILHMS